MNCRCVGIVLYLTTAGGVTAFLDIREVGLTL